MTKDNQKLINKQIRMEELVKLLQVELATIFLFNIMLTVY